MISEVRLNAVTNFEGKFVLRCELDRNEHKGPGLVAVSLAGAEPNGCNMDLVVDVEQSPGGEQNTAQDFHCPSGNSADLGRWRVTPGKNTLLIAGATNPLLNRSPVSLALEIKLVEDQG